MTAAGSASQPTHGRNRVTAEASAFPTIESSRKALLHSVRDAPNLTLVRPLGNFGDELIWAGTRQLLDRHVYREIGIEELPSASGELAVIAGGGAWGRRFNELMPEVLAIAELRFSRVIVFPSTFEVAEDRVRAALTNSKATIFARELESYRQISGICRAQIAHDGAFYYDYSKFREVDSAGQLNAFRTDDERLGLIDSPDDNDDISLTAGSLDGWLTTIAEHDIVNTDRAHVMIAAAMMGKRVNYAPCSYFKVDAIAESTLVDYDVHRLPETTNGRTSPGTAARNVSSAPKYENRSISERVTIAVLGRDAPDSIDHLISSIAENATATNVIVHDRNSRPPTRRVLHRVAARHPSVEFRFADRDPGMPACMRLAAQDARSEFVMFVDYKLRLEAGALDRMFEMIDSDRTIQAVAPTVVGDDGIVRSSGGWPVRHERAVAFEFVGRGLTVDQLETRSCETGWIPLRGSLIRRSALEAVPLAKFNDSYTQNADWSLRAATFGPHALRNCPEAVVIDLQPADSATEPTLIGRRFAVAALPAQTGFYRRHDRVLVDRLGLLVPEMKDAMGEVDAAAAALLLACVESRGENWTLMEWMNGGLAPIFAGVGASTAESFAQQRERIAWLELRNEMLTGIENGSWWKLRERVGPLRRVASRMRGGNGGGPAQ